MRNIDQSDVQATLRDMWETRPARRADDRKVAGVAAAIARRYDLDPTLVRIGFVVAAFSGIGAVLYVAGWLALPSQPGEGGQPRSRQGLAIAGLVVAAAISFGWWGDGPGLAPLLVGLGAIGLLFVLHRSRSEQVGGARTGVAGFAAADAPTTATGTGPSLVKEGVPMTDTGAPAPVASPPSWDPLGAAPFAWDLPEPGPPVPEPAPRRLPVTPVTLGVALLAAAVTSFVLMLADRFTTANLPIVLGVLLAVVGCGLVVGSFVRAGRGLIPIALLLTALTWGALTVPATTWDSDSFGDSFGDIEATPLSVAQIQPEYSRSAGSISLDLTEVDLSAPQGAVAAPVRTRISAGAGDVTVTVPEDADVTVNAESGIGDVEVFDQSRTGPNSIINVTDDLGDDGVRSGRPLVLDIDMGAGSVEVHRD